MCSHVVPSLPITPASVAELSRALEVWPSHKFIQHCHQAHTAAQSSNVHVCGVCTCMCMCACWTTWPSTRSGHSENVTTLSHSAKCLAVARAAVGVAVTGHPGACPLHPESLASILFSPQVSSNTDQMVIDKPLQFFVSVAGVPMVDCY